MKESNESIRASGVKNTWESLRGLLFKGKGETQKTREQLDRERQERKFMAMVLLPDSTALSEHDVQMSEESREAALDIIGSDEFGQREADRIIEQIQTPVQAYGAEAVFDRSFADSREMRQILCFSTGLYGEEFVDLCHPRTLESVGKSCPSPARLDERIEEIRDMCERWKADPDKRDRAESWLFLLDSKYDEFKKIVYGKREEYHQVYKRLQREAAERLSERPPFERYTREEGVEMLGKSECEGDPVPLAGGGSWELTTSELLNANLEPKYKVEVDGMEIGLSGIFNISGGRDGAIGYVKCPDGKIMQRSFYRSNSQGVWRLLPDYVLSEKERWYGKGYSEEMMILPSEMQKALSAITQVGRVDLEGRPGEAIFFGTAKHYNSQDEYLDCLAKGMMRGRLYSEVSQTPAFNLDGRSGDPDRKAAPEFVRAKGNYYMQPNFNDETADYYTQTSMYGVVGVNCVRSNDKQLKYIFNYASVQYENGQSEPVAWLGGVELQSPMTSGGIRSCWISAGDLSTPPLEYADQAFGYGEESKKRGHYVSMWRKYVSQLSLIRRYCSAKIKQARSSESLSA